MTDQSLTREQALEVIEAHEWHFQEDLKHVMCPSCGARFRAETKKKNHRQGCNWVKLTLLVGHSLASLGKL